MKSHEHPLQGIVDKLEAGHRLYHRHQEYEIKVEPVEGGLFRVTEAEFMGDRTSREMTAEELTAFLSKSFSSVAAIERLLSREPIRRSSGEP